MNTPNKFTEKYTIENLRKVGVFTLHERGIHAVDNAELKTSIVDWCRDNLKNYDYMIYDGYVFNVRIYTEESMIAFKLAWL